MCCRRATEYTGVFQKKNGRGREQNERMVIRSPLRVTFHAHCEQRSSLTTRNACWLFLFSDERRPLLLLYFWLSSLSFLLKFIQFADCHEIIDNKFISYNNS